MPTITDIAICIRHWDYSETSQTVSLFSRHHGVVRGLAKGSKREKANFSGGIDLFARGELRAITKPATELANIVEWSLLEARWFLREDLAAHRRALYFADLIHHMVRDHDSHERLFDAFEAGLSGLDDHRDLEAATARFLWMLLLETGYQPQVLCDAATGGEFQGDDPLAFSPQAGGVVAAVAGLGDWRLRRETLAVLQQLSRWGDEVSNPAADREFPLEQHPPMDSKAARRAGGLLSAYVRTILGYEPATLKWVFPELAGKPR